jgi:carbon storage regulator
MLILSRKPGESIVIDGRITVKIMRLEGDMVKLGIVAPAEVPVHRQEVYEEIQRNNQEAVASLGMKLPRLTASKASLDTAKAISTLAASSSTPAPTT